MTGAGRFLGVAVLGLLAMGSLGCELFNQPPDIVCDDPILNLTRGECLELENSCGGVWERGDALLLEGEYTGIYLESERDPRKWFMCAAEDARAKDHEPVAFSYIDAENNKGTGTFIVSIGFSVEVVETPLNDGRTQLDVFVTGGEAPFTYAWDEDPTLSATDIPNPIASPMEPTQYVVTVTDDANFVVVTDIVVGDEGLPLAITVDADRTTIAPGETIQLSATVLGGTPPYTYEWAPPELISDISVPNPTATLTESTTIFASVTDADSTLRASSIDITVTSGGGELMVAGSATSDPGEGTVLLDVAASDGTPPYSYAWSTGETTQSIVVAPSTTTEYSVTVTDADDASGMVTLQALVACFELAPTDGGDPPRGGGFPEVHPECTNGPAGTTTYYWFNDWDPLDDPATIDENEADLSSTGFTFLSFYDGMSGQPQLGLHLVGMIAIDPDGNRYFTTREYFVLPD